MLILQPADGRSPWLPQIRKLYESSFPDNERRPLDTLLNDQTGAGEVFAALDEGRFVGLAVLLTHGDLTHILYFAVEAFLRGRGYGSDLLAAIRGRYPGQRILADVEAPDPRADNRAQRERRIAFYRRNGYEMTEIRYNWVGENYVILSAGGPVTGPEFGAFWHYFYSLNAGYDY